MLKIAKKQELAIYNYKLASNLFKAVNKMEDVEICCRKIEEIQKNK